MESVKAPKSEKGYALLALLTFVASFLLFLYTLAPSVSTIFDDSLEFQVVCPQLGIAHPTGYPLYTLLGKLSTWLPVGDLAYRINLLSALCGALTAVVVALIVARAAGHRSAGFAAGLALSAAPVFWAESTIADVHSLNSLFIVTAVYCALRWKESRPLEPERPGKWFWLTAATLGLSLTNHRTSAFLVPALLVFLFLVDRLLLRRPRVWLGLIACLVLPQALYAYLPLRGLVTSSLDGSYHNTLQGFFRYVMASDYNVFLTGNPMHQSRGVLDFARLFYHQFHTVGIILAGVGVLNMLRRSRHLLFLIGTAFVVFTAFAVVYQVTDFEMYFIPSFVFVAIWLGFGLALCMDVVARLVSLLMPKPAPIVEIQIGVAPGSEPRDVWRPPLALVAGSVAAIVPLAFLLNMRADAARVYPYQDRSRDWSVYDYGKDMIEQPMEKGARIIGIQGETTLLRYFQIAEYLQPDIVTVAADSEPARRLAVAENLEAGHAVYLTRPLSGIADLYNLSAVGPLIRVQKRPGITDVRPDYGADIFFGDSIHLLGYNLMSMERHWRNTVRLVLFWEVTGPIDVSYKVSTRVYNKDGDLVGQTDAFPVHDAYPTTAWRPGEVIRDVYDIPIVPGTPPGPVKLTVLLYDPDDGEEVARADLRSLSIKGVWDEPPVGDLAVDHVVQTDVLDGVQLVGYSLLDKDMVFKQGETVPLNLLWLFSNGPIKDGAVRVWLEGIDAVQVQSIPQVVDTGTLPRVAPLLLRQWTRFPITARVPDGVYSLNLAAYSNEAEAQAGRKPGIVLGRLTVKGRDRSFEVPEMQTQIGAILDRQVTLLGFDLNGRTHAPGDRLKVTVYWRAKAEMTTSYTVFVHLVAQDGSILAQQDIIPHNGEWPTTGWVPGEVIADDYELSISSHATPGTYRLIAGMYRADTGQRLTATAGNNNPMGDFVPLTEITVQ